MKRTLVALFAVLVALLAVGALAYAFSSGDRAVPPTQPGQPGQVEPGRQAVPAPIDDVDVQIRESNPPQVAVRIQAGLPSGCAQKHSHSVTRDGDTITITVLNTVPTGDAICTMIYGMYDLTVELGSDFQVGKTYTLKVNDQTTTFRT